MRIIAGLYKGRKLKSPADQKTRPTSDRLRETLFNILSTEMSTETRFLDLCAGTGAVGIEALSRGAGFVDFVEISRKNCGLIESNLDSMGIPESMTHVECTDAVQFAKKHRDSSWNLAYFDPPYSSDYSDLIGELGGEASSVIAPEGTLIVEHHFKTLVPDEVGRLRRWRVVKQGDVRLSFFEGE